MVAPATTLDFYVLDSGFQRRHIKLSAWGSPAVNGLEALNVEISRFWPGAPAAGRNIKVWGSCFKLRNIKALLL